MTGLPRFLPMQPLIRTLPCLLASILFAAGCGDSGEAGREGQGSSSRQAEVAEAGRQVMPFDLEATTHVFEKLEDGGLQTVVSDDGDPEQIALIREHLAEEADRFGRGDFHDPAMIHGEDMAGLHELVMGHERLEIVYREAPGGGEIRYRTDDPELVAAIHRWFDAQLMDHGAHARDHR